MMEITNSFLDVKTIQPNEFTNKDYSKISNNDALKKVCNDFESFFLNQFLETSLKSSNLAGESAGADIFKGMYTDSLSRSAGGNLGISEMLYKFLSEKKS